MKHVCTAAELSLIQVKILPSQFTDEFKDSKCLLSCTRKNKFSVQWNSCFEVHANAGNKNKYKKYNMKIQQNTKTEQQYIFGMLKVSAIYMCKLCRLLCANVVREIFFVIPVSCSGV